MNAANPKQQQLSTLKQDNWCIDDTEAAHAEHPASYQLPPLAERTNLPAGSRVKIRLYLRIRNDQGAMEDCGERMRVKILAQ